MKKTLLTLLLFTAACSSETQAPVAIDSPGTHATNTFDSAFPCTANDSRHGLCPKDPK